MINTVSAAVKVTNQDIRHGWTDSFIYFHTPNPSGSNFCTGYSLQQKGSSCEQIRVTIICSINPSSESQMKEVERRARYLIMKFALMAVTRYSFTSSPQNHLADMKLETRWLITWIPSEMKMKSFRWMRSFRIKQWEMAWAFIYFIQPQQPLYYGWNFRLEGDSMETFPFIIDWDLLLDENFVP
jgi:hypothetical protein